MKRTTARRTMKEEASGMKTMPTAAGPSLMKMMMITIVIQCMQLGVALCIFPRRPTMMTMSRRNLGSKRLKIFADSEFDEEGGNLATAAEVENGPVYLSPLSAPPARRKSVLSVKSSDPWSAGMDPWTREIKSDFANKYRNSDSPNTDISHFADMYRASPTADSALGTTRALFAPSEASDGSSAVEPPPIATGNGRRRTRDVATNLSVPEARRARFLPPCSCAYPPGFGDAVQYISCETQTCFSHHFTQSLTVSEEGSSHLADDGWAETQCCKSDVSHSPQVFHEQVKQQIFPQYDLMNFVDVGFEGADSVDVDGSAEIDEQVVVV